MSKMKKKVAGLVFDTEIPNRIIEKADRVEICVTDDDGKQHYHQARSVHCFDSDDIEEAEE